MARLVTPIGTTSKTHHIAASRAIARAPLPSRVKIKFSPWDQRHQAMPGKSKSPRKTIRRLRAKKVV